MMSQIYSNAHLVMTWLGEPEPQEHAALDALQECIDGRSSKQRPDLIRQGLRYLGDSPYWSRIWIIQEMVLARRAKFRVGDYDFDCDSIYRMRLKARKSNTWRLQDMGWAMTNILDLRQDWYKGRHLDLLSGMHDFRAHKCSDPRDKIYGLLGLLEDKPCIADYSKSCKDLYVEIVLWALEKGLIRTPARGTSDWSWKRKDSVEMNPYLQHPYLHLPVWSTILGLSKSERQRAHKELAEHLRDDWPLKCSYQLGRHIL